MYNLALILRQILDYMDYHFGAMRRENLDLPQVLEAEVVAHTSGKLLTIRAYRNETDTYPIVVTHIPL